MLVGVVFMVLGVLAIVSSGWTAEAAVRGNDAFFADPSTPEQGARRRKFFKITNVVVGVLLIAIGVVQLVGLWASIAATVDTPSFHNAAPFVIIGLIVVIGAFILGAFIFRFYSGYKKRNKE